MGTGEAIRCSHLTGKGDEAFFVVIQEEAKPSVFFDFGKAQVLASMEPFAGSSIHCSRAI